jgi:hypothetical protein
LQNQSYQFVFTNTTRFLLFLRGGSRIPRIHHPHVWIEAEAPSKVKKNAAAVVETGVMPWKRDSRASFLAFSGGSLIFGRRSPGCRGKKA